MSDYLDEDEKPKSRLVSSNYQFCIIEKQAYILQVQVYDHEMTEGEFKSKMIDQANYFTYICEQLIKCGRPVDTPVAIIHWGTTNEQMTLTGSLSSIVELANKSKIKNPSMIIVGEVVKLREKINWFKENTTNEISVTEASV